MTVPYGCAPHTPLIPAKTQLAVYLIGSTIPSIGTDYEIVETGKLYDDSQCSSRRFY